MKIPNITLFITANRNGNPVTIWKTPAGWTGAEEDPTTGGRRMYNYMNRNHIAAMIEAEALTDPEVITAGPVPNDLISAYPGLDESVISYYTYTFEWSEDVDDIPSYLTFYDVLKALDDRKDVYMYLGPYSDSIVRERVFDRLAEVLRVDYEVIYQKWIIAR